MKPLVRAVKATPLRPGDLTGEVFSPRTGHLLSRIGHLPPNKVKLELLAPNLRDRFVHLDMVDPSRQFIRRHPPMGTAKRMACEVISAVASPMHFGFHAMQLLESSSSMKLLKEAGAKLGTLVDVGAGSGYVTEQLAQVFQVAVATDHSWPCCIQLRARGLGGVHGEDLSHTVVAAALQKLRARSAAEIEEHRFVDVVAALNVLDRCSRPRRLLAQLRSLAHPQGGRVLLALRLPIDEYVVSPAGNVEAPEEPLLHPQRPSRASGVWEDEFDALARMLQEEAGLFVERFSRVPYLCQGEHPVTLPFTALDDAVLVCRPV